ncbi:hypothetical protein CDAR_27721 [Caerostris darwini]|uniref:Uncharacterized protein n=1 Tax=Caerostris darwini TaxID=1538125 RepID=A0AAV4SRY1_9ARAC|nr:hypothetical protein CDAR_27721 [Caerostris darwini]
MDTYHDILNLIINKTGRQSDHYGTIRSRNPIPESMSLFQKETSLMKFKIMGKDNGDNVSDRKQPTSMLGNHMRDSVSGHYVASATHIKVCVLSHFMRPDFEWRPTEIASVEEHGRQGHSHQRAFIYKVTELELFIGSDAV